MSRTLHVIDQPGPIAEAAVLRLSLDSARLDAEGQTDQHAWLLFGGEATRDTAHAIGLHDEQFRLFPEPAGLHRLIPATLAQPRRFMNQAHRVVCWTEGATQIASLIGCAHVVRRVEHAGLCDFAQGIIAQAQRAPTDPMQPSRASLRERWGVEEKTTVIALIGDRFDQIDASAAMMSVALTHEALRAVKPGRADIRLLCHPLTQRRSDASELGGLLKMGHLLIQDDGVSMPWSVLPGCDAALAINPREAGLSILWSQAMVVPIFAPREKQLPMLETLSACFPIRSTKPSDMADALTDWVSAHATQPTYC